MAGLTQSTALILCSWLLAFHLLPAHATARGLSAKPGYQTFTLDGSSSRRVEQPSAAAKSLAPGTWTVDVVHRDRLPGFKPQGLSDHDALVERLARDAARVEAISERLQVAFVGGNIAEWKPLNESVTSEVTAADFSSPVVSGLSQGSGEYFTRFGLGTPPRESYFVVDTGSDLSWTQCRPCGSCYSQSDPIFNPAASSSYQALTCSNALCSQLLVRGCQSNQCLYQVSYGDGSFTVGDFALETFTFVGSQLKGVALGCGHDNEGLFVGAAGLLGLGAGLLSFPSQLKSEFSYCLADRFSGGSSSLIFGPGAAPSGSAFTPLLKNARLGTFYYINLQAISVGGAQLSISPSDFSLQSSGNGGVILDSGTSITRLVAPAYAALRDAFKAGTTNLPSAGSFSLFDTCYALGGMQSVDVPTVDLHFAGGTTLSLPASNYLIPVDSMGTYCLGFAGTNSDFSIIGNMQQQGYRVYFNSAAGRVGFAASQC